MRRALAAEKDALLRAHRAGRVSDESLEQLLADVDARLLEVGQQEGQ
ncbi:MAG: hypothetical protein JNK82_11260 [Myxococcaceae bacterium]|nr:hypothetical protein [Myxococcaceae bacterium]